MVEVWDRAAVLAFAPDSSSSAAADRLAARGDWVDHGQHHDTLWGVCRGSAAEPYQTTIELASPPAYACSCPSRKSPCKHVLALLLLRADGAVSRVEEPPAFVRRWLDGQQTTTRTRRPAGVLADPAAAAKRAEARVQRVRTGMEELDLWLADQVRGGIATLEHGGYAQIDQMAARMVDAQAPGVAGTLRAIPGQLHGEDWPARVLAQLAGLRLLIQAHRRLDTLPGGLADTVRSRVGYPVSRESVLARPGVRDFWQAVAQIDSVDFQLETRRVWLYGRDTGRWAMWMAFAPPGAELDGSIRSGFSYRGDFHFYPGAGQYRALPGPDVFAQPGLERVSPEMLSAVGTRFAELIAADPWAERMPVIIEGRLLAPVAERDHWRLVDRQGRGCQVELGVDPWPLVAQTVDGPAAIAGEWRSRGLRILGLARVDHGSVDHAGVDHDRQDHEQVDHG